MWEGWTSDEDWVRHGLVFAALPDGHTVVRLEQAALIDRRAYTEMVMGVKLEVPNDLFNLHQRVYTVSSGEVVLNSHQGALEALPLASPWVNVDGRLSAVGIYGAETWTLVRRGVRIGGYAGSILTDALCYPARMDLQAVHGPAVLLDTGCLVLSAVDAERTQQLWDQGGVQQLAVADSCRAVRVTGLDGRTYVLAANFGVVEQVVDLAVDALEWCELGTNEIFASKLRVSIDAGKARLFVSG